MQSIGLVLCFHHTQPPGTTGAEVRRAFERAYLPLLELLSEFPTLKVAMHWSGPLLEWLERHAPSHLDHLLGLVASGQVEVVGGLHGGAILPALPERDIVGQVQLMGKWWKDHGNPPIRGAWLPQHAWDPAAARILGRMGLQYTVLEESQFVPAVPSDGYCLSEREGTTIALFPADARLARMVPEVQPRLILDAITRRAADGARCLTLAIPAESLGAAIDSSATRCFGGQKGWVRRFLATLVENAHWLKLVSFGTVLDRLRPTERAYPPASISLPVAVAALGGAAGARYAGILAETRRGDPELARVAPFLRGVPWDQLLVRQPEVNRLHKRMLRVSLEVRRLRSFIKDFPRSAPDRALLEEALDDASRALYRGQNGAAYILGTDIGSQDGGIRHIAWSNLIRAEYMVASALGEAERSRTEQVDYDCDGRNEIIVRNRNLCGIVAPSCGGSLVELDLWSLPGNLLNTRARREEPEHAQLKNVENLPKLYEEPEVEVTDEGPTQETGEVTEPVEIQAIRTAEEGLSGILAYDRHLRHAFVDRFLGPETTLHNLKLGRFPEVGDFVGADYQLISVEEENQGTTVGLGRDGNVNDGAAVRLVRLVKRYLFHRETAAVDVRYEIANRYHDPIRSRFAVEINLNLDSLRSNDTYLDTGDGNRRSLYEEGDAGDVSSVALVDEERGYRVVVSLKEQGRLWYYPVETVSRTPKGMGRVYQGMCLCFWWPVELWGLERKRLEMSLSVES